MDSRDIQRLDELLQFKRVLLEKEIQMNGMIADNLSKIGEVAHTGKDFEELINGMGHNDYPYYRG